LAKLRITAAFDFAQLDTVTGRYKKITDPAQRTAIVKQVSPLYQVSADDPPILLIHGYQDSVVPLQQSESLYKRLRQASVPTRLIIKKGGAHGWPDMEIELNACAD
jgi:dipeptidyl aminopeptidase/acylaminoacyl peptidase